MEFESNGNCRVQNPEYRLNKSVADYFGLKFIRISAEDQDFKDVKAGELSQILRSIFYGN